MEDQQAIEALMYAYCRAIDRGDFQTFSTLFAQAQWLVEGETPSPASAQNVILYQDGTPRTKHVVTNVETAVLDNGVSATGHSYVTVYQQVGPRPLEVIFVGEYFDEFVREAGVWRFSRRDIQNPLYGDLSRHLRNPQATFPQAPRPPLPNL
jgi:3-phenylpropionate/cinnamic acid dioxygenase small subunit